MEWNPYQFWVERGDRELIGWVKCPKCKELGMLVRSNFRRNAMRCHYGVLHLSVQFRWTYHRIPIKTGIALIGAVAMPSPSIRPV